MKYWKKGLEEERRKREELEARLSENRIRDLVYSYLKNTIPPEIADLVLSRSNNHTTTNNNYMRIDRG